MLRKDFFLFIKTSSEELNRTEQIRWESVVFGMSYVRFLPPSFYPTHMKFRFHTFGLHSFYSAWVIFRLHLHYLQESRGGKGGLERRVDSRSAGPDTGKTKDF